MPDKKFIIDRINKTNLQYDKILYYDKAEKKIFDSSQEMKILLVSNQTQSNKDNTNKEKKETLNSKSEILSPKSDNEDLKKHEKKIINNLNTKKNSKEEQNLANIQKFKNPIKFENEIYKETLKFVKNYEINITNEEDEIIKTIPKFPIVIGNKIDINYYAEIYHYLYVNKNNLSISAYPTRINNTKNKKTRDNKKRDFRKKANRYYIENDKLYMKVELKEEDKKKFNVKSKIIIEDSGEYLLQYVPEKFDIISYLNLLHKEDGHKGIASLRNYLYSNNIFLEGSSYLIKYIIQNCISCSEKNKKSLLKREPAKQILTFYPKQRYIMDITDIPNELKLNNNYKYIFNIIDHFSKYGMSCLIENKESNTIFKALKICLECNGFPEELGSDNGKEFRNKIIEGYLKDKNIKYIHGNPYNPHSQGVVERFHKTVKDALYCLYADNPESFNIKENLEIVIKKYNNHIHSTTKFSPNQIFYSDDEELFQKVLTNIKNSFKYIGKDFMNFNVNEKCLLIKKIKIQKKGDKKKAGVLIYDKIKNKNIYGKINITIVEKVGDKYKIKIENDYPEINLKKNDLYMAEYKLIRKCSLIVWNNLLKSNKDANEIIFEEDSLSDEEKDYIIKNKYELE